jgi:CBS domain containing-hemolysin-like protein
VFIGVGPRTLGRQHPDELGVAIAAPLRALATLLGPLTKLLILLGNALTPGKGFRQGPFSSEVELRELVDMASTSGVVDENERKMIHSVFELGDTLVREVMVPRPDVVWVERDTTIEKVLRLALRSGYSRLPVLGENIDDVVGVAYLKDLVRAQSDAAPGDAPPALLTAVMRPAVYIPDSKRIDELLKEMQRTRNHMAIVVDEYGGTAGVVTIEDILEEIVGEITDEYDADEVPDVARLDDGRLRVAARLPVEDLVQLFPDDYADYEADEGVGAALRAVLEDADVDTVGGLVAHQLGRVPLPGSEVEVAGLHLLAEGGKDARGRVRITTVLVTPPPDETDGVVALAENRANGQPVGSDEPEASFVHPAPDLGGPDDPTIGRSTDDTRRDAAGVPAGRREETDVRPG